MIIFDTNNLPFYNNQIFIKNIADKYPGAGSIYLLSILCKKNNIPIFTADYVIEKNIQITGAKIITEISTKWTKLLVKRGAIRHAIVCLETPSFAWNFYANLNSITKNYKHSFLFSGTKDKISKNSIFHSSLFPQPEFKLNKYFENNWNNRTFLTLINSNQIRRIYKPLHIFYSIFDKSLSQEFYTLRLKAIVFFAKYNDFHLYGRNWEKKYFGISKNKYKIALSKYRGSVKNKIECLSRYKFSICFENASYKGYITEKIFDCFFGGCIPIYFGAPDIEFYIPKDCFINFSNFNYDFYKLEEYLLNFTELDYIKMKLSIKDFLQSDDFKKFGDNYYASEIFNTIKIN
jgi:hypothetical protein